MRKSAWKKIITGLLVFTVLITQIVNYNVARALSFEFLKPRIAQALSEAKEEKPIRQTSLIAILVEEELYNLSSKWTGLSSNDKYNDYLAAKTLRQRIDRFALDLQQTGRDTESIIVKIPKNSETYEIAETLEKLYLDDTDDTDKEIKQLIGTVLIGNIPIPVVNKNGNKFASMYPYTDFTDKLFSYDPETKDFVFNSLITNPQAEIWHGVISAPAKGDEGLERLAFYFDKNHLFHLGQTDYAEFDQRILINDLIGERDGINRSAYDYYLARLKSWEDIEYLRYNKTFLREIYEHFMGSMMNKGDGIDNDGDGRIDEEGDTFTDLDGDGLKGEDLGDGLTNIDNDGDGLIDEDGLDDNDNDGDGKRDEDPPGDANGDGCPGVCGVDDDNDAIDSDLDGVPDCIEKQKGTNHLNPKKKPLGKYTADMCIDEGDPNDDDEDGLVDEDGFDDNDADGDGLVDEDPAGLNLGAAGDSLSMIPDVQSKALIDRFFRRYYELFTKYLGEWNDRVEIAGRWNVSDEGRKELDTMPALISKKNADTKTYLKAVNDVFEKTVDKIVTEISFMAPLPREIYFNGSLVYDGKEYKFDQYKFINHAKIDKKFYINGVCYACEDPNSESASCKACETTPIYPLMCTYFRGSQPGKEASETFGINSQLVEAIRTGNLRSAGKPDDPENKSRAGCYGNNYLTPENCFPDAATKPVFDIAGSSTKIKTVDNPDEIAVDYRACYDFKEEETFEKYLDQVKDYLKKLEKLRKDGKTDEEIEEALKDMKPVDPHIEPKDVVLINQTLKNELGEPIIDPVTKKPIVIYYTLQNAFDDFEIEGFWDLMEFIFSGKPIDLTKEFPEQDISKVTFKVNPEVWNRKIYTTSKHVEPTPQTVTKQFQEGYPDSLPTDNPRYISFRDMTGNFQKVNYINIFKSTSLEEFEKQVEEKMNELNMIPGAVVYTQTLREILFGNPEKDLRARLSRNHIKDSLEWREMNIDKQHEYIFNAFLNPAKRAYVTGAEPENGYEVLYIRADSDNPTEYFYSINPDYEDPETDIQFLNPDFNIDPKDKDGDGLTDKEEAELGTDPENEDTDGDGLTDYEEVKGEFAYMEEKDYKMLAGINLLLAAAETSQPESKPTNPLNQDTDGDGLTDGDEIKKFGTNPLKADTDGDGFNDKAELEALTDPNDPESNPNNPGNIFMPKFSDDDDDSGKPIFLTEWIKEVLKWVDTLSPTSTGYDISAQCGITQPDDKSLMDDFLDHLLASDDTLEFEPIDYGNTVFDMDEDLDGIPDSIDGDPYNADTDKDGIPDGSKDLKSLKITPDKSTLLADGADTLKLTVQGFDSNGKTLKTDNFTQIEILIMGPDEINLSAQTLINDQKRDPLKYAQAVSLPTNTLSGGITEFSIMANSQYEGVFGIVAVTTNREGITSSNRIKIASTKEHLELTTFQRVYKTADQGLQDIEKILILKDGKEIAELSHKTGQIFIKDSKFEKKILNANLETPNQIIIKEKNAQTQIATLMLLPKHQAVFLDGPQANWDKFISLYYGTHIQDLNEKDNIKFDYSNSLGGVDIKKGSEKLGIILQSGKIALMKNSGLYLDFKSALNLSEPFVILIKNEKDHSTIAQVYIEPGEDLKLIDSKGQPVEVIKENEDIIDDGSLSFNNENDVNPLSSLFGIGTAVAAGLSKDTDNDGLSDLEEFIIGSDWNNPDTDGDGFMDGEEVRNGYDPLRKFQPIFTDLPNKHEAFSDILTLYLRGILQGYTDHSFKPDNKITREEFIKVDLSSICLNCTNYDDKIRENIETSYNKNPFPDSDINPELFYCVAYGKNQEIISGYQAGQDKDYFKPRKFISRAEAIKVILETTNLLNSNYPIENRPWYYNYVLSAQKLKILPKGRFAEIDNFDEQSFKSWFDSEWVNQGSFIKWLSDGITRGEFAMLVVRILEKRDCMNSDKDSDGLSDTQERFEFATDVEKADSDLGGVSDLDEIIRGTDPRYSQDDKVLNLIDDKDSDGLSDLEEGNYKTDPSRWDTDGGGQSDGSEVNEGKNPLDPSDDREEANNNDYDGDGLANADEFKIGTDLNSWDTDNGGESDGSEVNRESDPLKQNDDNPHANINDFDGDGISNQDEKTLKTDINNDDTDNGGEKDLEEISRGSNPLDPKDDRKTDSDGDGLSDDQESKYDTDPNKADTDEGGESDGSEVNRGSNPLDPKDDNKNTNSNDLDGDSLDNNKEIQFGTDPNNADTDGGGESDGSEVNRGSNPLDPKDDNKNAHTNDLDGDSLNNNKEVQIGTDPNKADTDDGGENDGSEVNRGSDPLDPKDDNKKANSNDLDGDSLENNKELQIGTDPNNADTDGGGESDGSEVNRGSNPLDSKDDNKTANPNDLDGDSLDNNKETQIGTDPNNADTDGGGESDGSEVNHGSNPLDPSDDDNDGDSLSNTKEAEIGTDPNKADTDGGGESDGSEVNRDSNPLNPEDDDADSDSLNNKKEAEIGTDPNKADTDGGGESDGSEVENKRDPLNPEDDILNDSDRDGLTDEQEKSLGTNPNNADTDGDGLSDADELIFGTDPKNSGDGLKKTIYDDYNNSVYLSGEEFKIIYKDPSIVEQLNYTNEIVSDGKSTVLLQAQIRDSKGNIKAGDNKSVIEFIVKYGDDSADIKSIRVQAIEGVAETTIQSQITAGIFEVSARIVGNELPVLDKEIFVYPQEPRSITIEPKSKVLKNGGISETSVNLILKDVNGNLVNNNVYLITLSGDGPIQLPQNLDEDKQKEGIQISTLTGVINFKIKSAESEESGKARIRAKVDYLEDNPNSPVVQSEINLQVVDDIVLNLSSDKKTLKADETSSAMILLEAQDKNGKIFTDFNSEVEFSLVDDSFGKFSSKKKVQIENGRAVIGFKSGKKAGEALITAQAKSFDPVTLKMKILPLSPDYIELKADNENILSGNEYKITAKFFDKNGNLANTNWSILMKLRLTDQSKNFAELKSKSVTAKNGIGEIFLTTKDITGPINLIATAKLRGKALKAGTLNLKSVKNTSSENIKSINPNVLYTVMLNMPAGDLSVENNLGSRFLTSGKTQAVTTLLDTADQFSPVVSMEPNGVIHYDSNSTNLKLRITNTDDLPLIIAAEDSTYADPVAETVIIPKENVQFNIISGSGDVKPTDGFYAYFNTQDQIGLGFKIESRALNNMVGQNTIPALNLYENGFQAVSIAANLNIKVFSADYSFDYITFSGYPALSIKKSGTEIANLVIVQNFQFDVKKVSHDFDWTYFTNLSSGVYVKQMGKSKFKDKTIFTGNSTFAPKGIQIYDPDSKISEDKSPGISATTLEDAALNPGIGFEGDNKFMLAFADGQSVGEANKFFASPIGITLGDPTIALKQNKVFTSGYTHTAGKQIFTGEEAIKETIISDFDNDKKKDLLLVYTDHIDWVQQVIGDDQYVPRGEVLRLKNKIETMDSGDFDGDGDDDLVIVSKDSCLKDEKCINIYINDNGSFKRHYLPLDTAKIVYQIKAGDINNDGYADIVTSDINGYLKVYYNKEGNINTRGQTVGNLGIKIDSNKNLKQEVLVFYKEMTKNNPRGSYDDLNFKKIPIPSEEGFGDLNSDLDELKSSSSKPGFPSVSMDEPKKTNEVEFVYLDADLTLGSSAKQGIDVNGGITEVDDEVLYEITLKNNSLADIKNLYLSDVVSALFELDQESVICEGCSSNSKISTYETGISIRPIVIQGIGIDKGKQAKISYKASVKDIPKINISLVNDFKDYPIDDDYLDIAATPEGNPTGRMTYFYSVKAHEKTFLSTPYGAIDEFEENKMFTFDQIQFAKKVTKPPKEESELQLKDLNPWGIDPTEDKNKNLIPDSLETSTALPGMPGSKATMDDLADLPSDPKDLMPEALQKIYNEYLADKDCNGIPDQWDEVVIEGKFCKVDQEDKDEDNNDKATFDTVAEAVEDGISLMKCNAGCIPMPINASFLTPGTFNAYGFPVAPDPGFPVFGLLIPIPFTPMIWPGLPFQVSTIFRLYLSPTLTGSLGVGACFGPFGTPACLAWGVPILNAVVDCDSIACALNEGLAKVNKSVQSHTGVIAIGGDGGGSGSSENAASGLRSESGGTVSYSLGNYQIPATVNTNVSVPGVGFVVDWLKNQTNEIISKLTDLPDIYIIYPNEFSGLFKANDKIKINNLDSLIAWVNSIPIIELKTKPLWIRLPWIAQKDIERMEEDWESVKEDFDKEIESFKSKYGSWDSITKEIADHILVDAGEFRRSIEQNIQNLQTYKTLPQEILKWRYFLEYMMTMIVCYLDIVQEFLGGYLVKLVDRAFDWMDASVALAQAIADWKLILNLVIDYHASCDQCKTDRFSLLEILINLFIVIPPLPIIAFPKWPDIVLDISQITVGIKFELPMPQFKAERIVFPPLPRLILPDLPYLKFKIPGIPVLPPAPELPPFPEFPKLTLPKLPLIPPPPKIPELPSELNLVISGLKRIAMMLCLLKNALMTVPELSLKTHIENITARSLTPLLPIDLGVTVNYPKIELDMVDKISVTTYVNFTPVINFYDIAKQYTTKINKTVTNFVEELNALMQSVSDSASKAGDLDNLTPDEIEINYIPDFNRDLGLNGQREQEILSQYPQLSLLTPHLQQLKTNIEQLTTKTDKLNQELKDTGYGDEIRLLAQEEIIDPKDPRLHRNIEDLKNNTPEFDQKLIARGYAPTKITTLRNSLLAYLEHTNQVNSNLNHLLENNKFDEFNKYLANSSGYSTDSSFRLASRNSETNSISTMTESETVELIKSTSGETKWGVEGNIQNWIAQIESDQGASGLFSDIEITQSLKGVYIYDEKTGVNERVVKFPKDASSQISINIADMDNDGDEEVFYSTGTDLYIKENFKKNKSYALNGSKPKVFGLDDLLPAGSAVSSFNLTDISNDAVSFEWQNKKDRNTAGYEIIYTERFRDLFRPKSKKGRINFIENSSAKSREIYLSDRVTYSVERGKAEVIQSSPEVEFLKPGDTITTSDDMFSKTVLIIESIDGTNKTELVLAANSEFIIPNLNANPLIINLEKGEFLVQGDGSGVDALLKRGTIINVGSGAKAEINFENGSKLNLLANTSFEVPSFEKAPARVIDTSGKSSLITYNRTVLKSGNEISVAKNTVLHTLENSELLIFNSGETKFDIREDVFYTFKADSKLKIVGGSIELIMPMTEDELLRTKPQEQKIIKGMFVDFGEKIITQDDDSTLLEFSNSARTGIGANETFVLEKWYSGANVSSFDLKIENGNYFSRMYSFDTSGRRSTPTNQKLLPPQICADNNAPYADAGAAKKQLSVFKTLTLDASRSFDTDSEIVSYFWDLDAKTDSNGDGDSANDIDYAKDLDPNKDSDGDYNYTNDKDDPYVNIGPFEDLEEKNIRLTVLDEARNSGKQDITIEMFVPDIHLNATTEDSGKISGNISSGDSQIPIAIIRDRNGVKDLIATASADPNKRYFTDERGEFNVEDLIFEDEILIKNSTGEVIAKVNPITGFITVLKDGYKLEAKPANENLPTRLELIEISTQTVYATLIKAADANTDVTIDPEESEFNENMDGVHVKDADPQDEVDFIHLYNDPKYPGGVKIVDNSDIQAKTNWLEKLINKASAQAKVKSKEDEKVLAIIDSRGNIYPQDQNVDLRLKKAESEDDPVIFELLNGNKIIGEIYIAVNLSRDVQVVAVSDNLILEKQSEFDSEENLPSDTAGGSTPKIKSDKSASNPNNNLISNNTNTTPADSLPFIDIPSGYPLYDVLLNFVNRGILQGYQINGQSYFKPDNLINRAEFTKIILKILCISPRAEAFIRPSVFKDIPFTNNLPWYYDEVKESYLQKFIAGYLGEIDPQTGLAPFKPANNITVAEAAKIVLEALEKIGLIQMGDVQFKEGEAWYDPYLRIAVDLNPYLKQNANISKAYILTPQEAANPEKKLTRAEFVEMASRVLNTYDCTTLDKDNDGMSDAWEIQHGLDSSDPDDAKKDPDGDRLKNLDEYKNGTDPNSPDTDNGRDNDGFEVTRGLNPLDPNDDSDADPDGDGLTNDVEKNVYGTDIYKADTDGGGVSDGDEVNKTKTDPLDYGDDDRDGDGIRNKEEKIKGTNAGIKDTDGDSLTDGEEVNKYGTDPLNPDTDGDGLTDGEEINKFKTDPIDADTDNGGIKDGEEVNKGMNPLDPADEKGKDSDQDGLSDDDESSKYKTDPNNSDTDGDGLTDGEEVNKYKTDPVDADTDNGGIKDGEEVSRGLDPLDKNDDTARDRDYDGISDEDEVNKFKTNPNNPDTDSDSLSDYDEIYKYKTDPLNADTDGDGINDGGEINKFGTDPLNPDTDSDSLSDYDEAVKYKTDPLDPDMDLDDLSDGEEINYYKTDPFDADTDNGGVKDGDEVRAGADPLNKNDDAELADIVDSDGDGLSDKDEKEIYKTDPLNPDTDSDGLTDGDEINKYKTDPLDADTDKGGVKDGAEVRAGADPLNKNDDAELADIVDSDGDGLSDKDEKEIYKTDPLNADTDSDGLTDGDEINKYKTDPLDADTDKGGVKDGAEVKDNTNPNDESDDKGKSQPEAKDLSNLDEGSYLYTAPCNQCPCLYSALPATDLQDGDIIYAVIMNSNNSKILKASNPIVINGISKKEEDQTVEIIEPIF